MYCMYVCMYVLYVCVCSWGIIVCLLTSFLATNIIPVTSESRIEPALRWQLIITTVLMIPATYLAAQMYIPESFEIVGVAKTMVATRMSVFFCVISGEDAAAHHSACNAVCTVYIHIHDHCMC